MKKGIDQLRPDESNLPASKRRGLLGAEFKQLPEQEQRYAALHGVGMDANRYWDSLPPEWKEDKEFILWALKKSPNLPAKSDFERLFPQSLRMDRDIVLAFARRPDFVNLFNERCLYCPEVLTGDKEVMLAYCKQIPRCLQDCSLGTYSLFSMGFLPPLFSVVW